MAVIEWNLKKPKYPNTLRLAYGLIRAIPYVLEAEENLSLEGPDETPLSDREKVIARSIFAAQLAEMDISRKVKKARLPLQAALLRRRLDSMKAILFKPETEDLLQIVQGIHEELENARQKTTDRSELLSVLDSTTTEQQVNRLQAIHNKAARQAIDYDLRKWLRR